jgi:hypothetical protein
MVAANQPAALGERLLAMGLVATVVAVALQTLAHWTNAFVLGGDVWNLDADEEGNAFTWASSAATFAGGLAALLWAATVAERRRGFLVLGAILVFFSLDDVIQLHEQLGLEFGTELLGLPDYIGVRLWTVFYTPLLLLVGVLLWVLPEHFWPRAAMFVRGGLVVLVAAFLVELVGAGTRWLEERGTAWPDDLRTGLEEGLELSGWMFVATGLVTALCVRLISTAVAERPVT